MSEYSEVERPFLDQLAAQGWTVIDQGAGVPREAASSLRGIFSESRLPGEAVPSSLTLSRRRNRE